MSNISSFKIEFLDAEGKIVAEGMPTKYPEFITKGALENTAQEAFENSSDLDGAPGKKASVTHIRVTEPRWQESHVFAV